MRTAERMPGRPAPDVGAPRGPAAQTGAEAGDAPAPSLELLEYLGEFEGDGAGGWLDPLEFERGLMGAVDAAPSPEGEDGARPADEGLTGSDR